MLKLILFIEWRIFYEIRLLKDNTWASWELFQTNRSGSKFLWIFYDFWEFWMTYWDRTIKRCYIFNARWHLVLTMYYLVLSRGISNFCHKVRTASYATSIYHKRVEWVIRKYQQRDACNQRRHSKKWSFPLETSSVNVTKSAVSCAFGQIYWENPLCSAS